MERYYISKLRLRTVPWISLIKSYSYKLLVCSTICPPYVIEIHRTNRTHNNAKTPHKYTFLRYNIIRISLIILRNAMFF